MSAPWIPTCLAAFLALALPALADDGPVEIGGDLYAAGAASSALPPAGRDLFIVGMRVTVAQDVAQDLHAAGFDVDVEAAVGGQVFAAGPSVSIDAPVAGDASISGLTVQIGAEGEIGGNARLAGADVTVNGPVLGALVAAGATVTLNATVSGDAVLSAGDITFGPDARIDGRLSYYSDDRIDVPERVIPSDRVSFEQTDNGDVWREARNNWRSWESPVNVSPWAMVGGFLINLALFMVLGALLLTLAPKTVRRLRRRAEARPGMVILTGAIGLSVLFGSLPISVLSVVGLPLIPIIMLLIILTWFLGYLLGAYVLAMGALRGLGGDETPGLAMRLLALAVGVTLVALLNFIPFLGWMANFALVLLGIGAITNVLFDSFMTGRGPERDQGLDPNEDTSSA